MRKKLSILFALVMAISLCLVPAVVQADDSVGLGVGVYTNTLTLENKDASWDIIGDSIGGTLGYNAKGEEFVWGLEATVLMSSTDYALIYYADKPDRFADWGGNNPGALISLVTSDEFGVISESGSAELGMDLPCSPDANLFEYDYGTGPGTTGDDYANVHGAKIWLVLADVLPSDWPSDTPWTTWDMASILFETDLIQYDDTGESSGYVVSISVNPTNIDFGILRPGEEGSDAITITSGNVPIDVTVMTGLTGVFTYLELDTADYSAYAESLSANSPLPVAVTLPVPIGYEPTGVETGTLTFIATAPH